MIRRAADRPALRGFRSAQALAPALTTRDEKSSTLATCVDRWALRAIS